jgi:hypothetical protein
MPSCAECSGERWSCCGFFKYALKPPQPIRWTRLSPPALPASFAANSSNVWLTGPLAKVMQNGGAPGSAQSITVYSTRNEIQSFQVHVQAGTSPINALNVTMSDLVNAKREPGFPPPRQTSWCIEKRT